MDKIIIHISPPPQDLYQKLRDAFGPTVDWERGTVFTYGTDIYTKYPLDSALLAHEQLHVLQQTSMEGGPDAWWGIYLTDPDFRLSQELDAYRVQYRMAQKYIKDRNALFAYLHDIAMTLASPMYGNLLSTREAIERIRQ